MYPPMPPYPMAFGYMPPPEMGFAPWPMMPGQFMPPMDYVRPPWPMRPQDVPQAPWDQRPARAERGGRQRVRPRIERSVYQPDPEAERPEDSKPCRTLFVRNVTFEVDIPAFRAEFEQFGAIKTFFDLIQRRGMVFVTYYDTRAAEQAKLHLNNKLVLGRALDVHYSLPRDEDQMQHCDRDKNQGTLFIVAEGCSVPFTDELLLARFGPFGDVKSVRPFKDKPNMRFIEYWDSRACVAAHDQLEGSEFFGGKLNLKFAWDLETVSLVSDARNRSEAKAAAEAKAREERHGRRRPEPPGPGAAPGAGPGAGPTPASGERLEQAFKVQQLLASFKPEQHETQSAPQGMDIAELLRQAQPAIGLAAGEAQPEAQVQHTQPQEQVQPQVQEQAEAQQAAPQQAEPQGEPQPQGQGEPQQAEMQPAAPQQAEMQPAEPQPTAPQPAEPQEQAAPQPEPQAEEPPGQSVQGAEQPESPLQEPRSDGPDAPEEFADAQPE